MRLPVAIYAKTTSGGIFVTRLKTKREAKQWIDEQNKFEHKYPPYLQYQYYYK